MILNRRTARILTGSAGFRLRDRQASRRPPSGGGDPEADGPVLIDRPAREEGVTGLRVHVVEVAAQLARSADLQIGRDPVTERQLRIHAADGPVREISVELRAAP